MWTQNRLCNLNYFRQNSVVQELILAAIDNTATIVEWALAHLLDQPTLKNKAVEELDRVIGKARWVQESDFQNLPYVKACAREALRLHPLVAFNLPHVARHDMEVARYFIPKGSEVRLSRVGLGRNPNVWPDPLRFDPTWSSDCGASRAGPSLYFIHCRAARMHGKCPWVTGHLHAIS